MQVLQSQGASQLVQEQAGGVPGPEVQADQRRRRVPVVHQQCSKGRRWQIHVPGQQPGDVVLSHCRRLNTETV